MSHAPSITEAPWEAVKSPQSSDARDTSPERVSPIPSSPACGYSHASYADSLADFGQVLPLPSSQGWLLKRPINDSLLYDAAHCYPLFVCQDWARLRGDIEAIGDRMVSVVVVTDPFGNYSRQQLSEVFPDICRIYKHHFVTDLRRPDAEFISSHHARYAKKALCSLSVSVASRPIECLDTWLPLYGQLVVRHQIEGIARFSRESFRLQLDVPGCVVLLAEHAGERVGMQIWYQDRDIGYYHLAAYSERGYALRASFALFAFALSEFRARNARYLALGAGAGAFDSSDGLAKFKRGWSTETRPAYLCGRICRPDDYWRLVEQTRTAGSPFFPRYRGG